MCDNTSYGNSFSCEAAEFFVPKFGFAVSDALKNKRKKAAASLSDTTALRRHRRKFLSDRKTQQRINGA